MTKRPKKVIYKPGEKLAPIPFDSIAMERIRLADGEIGFALNFKAQGKNVWNWWVILNKIGEEQEVEIIGNLMAPEDVARQIAAQLPVIGGT